MSLRQVAITKVVELLWQAAGPVGTSSHLRRCLGPIASRRLDVLVVEELIDRISTLVWVGETISRRLFGWTAVAPTTIVLRGVFIWRRWRCFFLLWQFFLEVQLGLG